MAFFSDYCFYLYRVDAEVNIKSISLKTSELLFHLKLQPNWLRLLMQALSLFFKNRIHIVISN